MTLDELFERNKRACYLYENSMHGRYPKPMGPASKKYTRPDSQNRSLSELSSHPSGVPLSFVTSLSLQFNNLLKKKNRIELTINYHMCLGIREDLGMISFKGPPGVHS